MHRRIQFPILFSLEQSVAKMQFQFGEVIMQLVLRAHTHSKIGIGILQELARSLDLL